jgi:hypothetical protein
VAAWAGTTPGSASTSSNHVLEDFFWIVVPAPKHERCLPLLPRRIAVAGADLALARRQEIAAATAGCKRHSHGHDTEQAQRAGAPDTSALNNLAL